jgi:hypothetical protein
METKSITSIVNLDLIKGKSEIQIPSGEHFVKRAFISVRNSSVSFFGDNSSIKGEGNVVEINGAENIVFSSVKFFSDCENDFTIRISSSSSVKFENCAFSSLAGCVVISDSRDIIFKNCEFEGENCNGICVMNASDVKVENCNFTLPRGEGITIADDRDGSVVVHNNSFKRCKSAIKSMGKNTLKITNNYFLTYNEALYFSPSLASNNAEGVYKAEIRYNLFDECCKDAGEATIVIKGENKGYTHKEITILENIFSQKERPVINATSVNYLIFKENNVHTNGESTVENCIINGIRA